MFHLNAEQDELHEKFMDKVREVFSKIEENRKTHREGAGGFCDCPTCNPSIANVVLEISEKTSEIFNEKH